MKLETLRVVQSQRLALYASAIENLWAKGAIYPCICTRADIAAQVAASASAPHESDAQPRYPGTCRQRFDATRPLAETLAAIHATTGKPACLRLSVPDQRVAFTDLIAGAHCCNVRQDAGDFPLTRFAITPPTLAPALNPHLHPHPVLPFLPPAYQLACVVDDHAMGMDMVIRGDDLLSSTPRQILLYEALGYAIPNFAHVPLVIGADGKRLAKRHGESRIAQFRAAGVTAERIVGWAAWRSGQLDRPQEISARDLVARFDLARLPRQRLTLTADDLAFLG